MSIYPRAVHVAGVWHQRVQGFNTDESPSAMDALTSLGVNVVLGERVVTWPEDPEHLNGKTKILTTSKGRTFHADLVVSPLAPSFPPSHASVTAL